MGEISTYGNCENVNIEDIPEDAWILELEDLEKDTARILNRLTKSQRSIKGVRHSFHKKDVLFSKLRTYLNKVLVAPEDGFCTTEIIPISYNRFIYPEYLNHVLRSNLFLNYTIQCGYGVKMPRLSTSDACNGLIPLPPYNEQKRIANIIDKIFQLIGKLMSNEHKLKERIQKAKSKILDLAIHGKLVPQDPNDEPAIELLKRINPNFKPSDNLHYNDSLPKSWIKCHLEDICVILDSQRRPINAKERAARSESRENKYPYYGATGQVGTINDYLLNGDYILLGEDGAPFLDSFAAKAYSVSGKIWVNNHAHILSPKINNNFFLYYLNYIDYHPYVTGSTRLKLTQEAMKKIVFVLPPLMEQQRIVEKIEKLFSVLDFFGNNCA